MLSPTPNLISEEDLRESKPILKKLIEECGKFQDSHFRAAK